jgi:hypothetical protein
MPPLYTPPGMDFQANPLAVALSQDQTPPNNAGMPYWGTPNFTGAPVGVPPSLAPMQPPFQAGQPSSGLPFNQPGGFGGKSGPGLNPGQGLGSNQTNLGGGDQDPFGGGVGIDRGKQAGMTGGGFNPAINSTGMAPVSASPVPIPPSPAPGLPVPPEGLVGPGQPVGMSPAGMSGSTSLGAPTGINPIPPSWGGDNDKRPFGFGGMWGRR